jgi:hypothetical protein
MNKATVTKKNKVEIKNDAVEFLKALNINVAQQTVLNPENYMIKPQIKSDLKNKLPKVSNLNVRADPRRSSIGGALPKISILGGEESMLAISNFILR